MQNFIYSAKFTRAKEGGFVVTFRDIPEAITQGESVEDALAEAADCLDEAIAGRIRKGEDIPAASKSRRGERMVSLPAPMAAKAALYLAMRQAGVTKVELAHRLHCDEKEVRRLLDPYHTSRLPRIAEAVAALGNRLVVGLEEAA